MGPSFQDLGPTSTQPKQHLHHDVPPGQYNFQPYGQHQLPVVYDTLSPNSSRSIAVRHGPQRYPNRKADPRSVHDEGQGPHPLISLEGALNSPTIKTESSTITDNCRVQAAAASSSPAMSGKKRSASTESVMTNGKKHSGAGRSKSPGKYSEQVQKSLAATSRTNQACDRCKVRKTKCDSLPGACLECVSKNEECITTDKVSGRAMRRGYVEGLEQKFERLEQKVARLQALLKAHGIPEDTQMDSLDMADPSINHTSFARIGTSKSPHMSHAKSYFQSTTQESLTSKAERTPDNYLGVFSGCSQLTSIKGTALSIFRMKIDIADFESIDMDEPNMSGFNPRLYNKSYQSFLQSALNINEHMKEPPLPPRLEAFQMIEWYFRAINPYIPFLHRPTFLALLERRYDDPNYQPLVAENVMIHMAFAVMHFQEACRNRTGDGTSQSTQQEVSNQHYHYSLGQYYHLVHSHGVQDVQALTMICSHLRNFPKPGASWILTQHTLARAFELNMHRSANSCSFDTKLTPLDVEMRKRIFWSLLTIHVTLSGKLGRPMSLRIEDFDIEIPEAISDGQLTHDGISRSLSEKCLHKVGIHAFQIVPLFMELYSTIYAVRRQPEKYISTVNKLEEKLQTWKKNLSPELVNGQDQEDRVFTLYSEVWAYEFRLLLRHPSVSMTNNEAFNADSLNICAQSARKMLSAVKQIQKFNCLDTTWYNTAVYVMAITTTLFAQYEKRNQISKEDFKVLTSDMGAWLDIMGHVGHLLGSGFKLQDTVKAVIVGTLNQLSQSIAAREMLRQNHLNNSSSPPVRLDSAPDNTTNNVSSNPQPTAYSNLITSPYESSSAIPTRYAPIAGSVQHQHTPYPQSTQYHSYSTLSEKGTHPSYGSHHDHTLISNIKAEEASDLVRFARQANQEVQDPHYGHNAFHQRDIPVDYSGPEAWNFYTAEAVEHFGMGEPFAVNTLIRLGASDVENNGIGVLHQDMRAHSSARMDLGHFGGDISSISSWPQAIFDMSQQA